MENPTNTARVIQAVSPISANCKTTCCLHLSRYLKERLLSTQGSLFPSTERANGVNLHYKSKVGWHVVFPNEACANFLISQVSHQASPSSIKYRMHDCHTIPFKPGVELKNGYFHIFFYSL